MNTSLIEFIHKSRNCRTGSTCGVKDNTRFSILLKICWGGEKKVSRIVLWRVSGLEGEEERLSRVIECETRHREGSEILHGSQDGARSMLNGLEVDLGVIILATLPKFVAEDAGS